MGLDETATAGDKEPDRVSSSCGEGSCRRTVNQRSHVLKRREEECGGCLCEEEEEDEDGYLVTEMLGLPNLSGS